MANKQSSKTDIVTLRFYIKQPDGTPGVIVQWEEDQIESLGTFTPLQFGLVCAGVIMDKAIPDEVKKMLNDFGYWFHKKLSKNYVIVRNRICCSCTKGSIRLKGVTHEHALVTKTIPKRYQ